MASFSKRAIAEYFKFGCDRFLRYHLASKEEISKGIVPDRPIGKMRPGIKLMLDAANKWEADKYNDLISFNSSVNYILDNKVDDSIGQQPFKKVENLFELLKMETPPFAIIEASFKVPETISPSFKILKEKYGVDIGNVNPDIILIRPFSSGSPLIDFDSQSPPQFELHIVDVKLASEASLKHFTEVTYYALALAEAIKTEGLDRRYKVSSQGLVWPGCHDENMFRNLVRRKMSMGSPNALLESLDETLQKVPYEVYEIHVRDFINNKVLEIIDKSPEEADWHIAGKCQLCQYLEDCQTDADTQDHLCKVPFLNLGQANLLRQKGISTSEELYEAINSDSENWQNVISENFQLKAAQQAILTRVNALRNNNPEFIDRECRFMPNWVDMSIYLTIHFDPGTGITFAIGAKKVYFELDRQSGDRPQIEERTFIVDNVNGNNAEHEKRRLIEFLDLVSGWLNQVNQDNEEVTRRNRANFGRDSDYGKKKLHFFFWSKLEVKQFLRMLERHLNDKDVLDRADTLINMFPPESYLPDPDFYRTQPGTIVKDVIKHTVGLPIKYEYTLFDTANNFFPNTKNDGTPFFYRPKYGFYTEMSDQIPFERAYELWKDNYLLTKADKTRYTRAEIQDELNKTLKMHLNALQNIVMSLRDKIGSKLNQKKTPFRTFTPQSIRLSDQSKKLAVFQRLNAIKEDIENRHQISLPVDEKEARFISIRGLVRSEDLNDEINILRQNPKYAASNLYAFTFSENSKDAKIKEGDFLCGISNEDFPIDFDAFWYKELGLSYSEGLERVNNSSHTGANQYFMNLKLSDLLKVAVVKIRADISTPFIILEVWRDSYIRFSEEQGLIDMSQPLVLDPITKDFNSDDVEKTLRLLNAKY